MIVFSRFLMFVVSGLDAGFCTWVVCEGNWISSMVQWVSFA